jgi:C1A family cysteine protease
MGMPRNVTRRSYASTQSKSRSVRNIGAKNPGAVSRQQLALAACDSTNVTRPECEEILLMLLMPASYSSNNTLNTPSQHAYISPAQDQGSCSSCVGFAVTAAAEAAVNVYQQQAWQMLNLSEQDLSFCK